MSLKIDVEGLLKADVEIDEPLDGAWMRRELAEFLHEAQGREGEGEVHLRASRTRDKVFVEGQIRARFAVPCGRCLEAAEVVLDEPFLMMFEPAVAVGELPPEKELTEADLHWDTYSGSDLDLAPFIREQLLLAVPMKPLCKPGCEGIPYSCAEPDEPGPEDDPRWKALAKLVPTR